MKKEYKAPACKSHVLQYRGILTGSNESNATFSFSSDAAKEKDDQNNLIPVL